MMAPSASWPRARSAPDAQPKVGSVTQDVTKRAGSQGGKVEYRVDKAGVVHARVGRISFDANKLAENATRSSTSSFTTTFDRQGVYLRSITLSSTMVRACESIPPASSGREDH